MWAVKCYFGNLRTVQQLSTIYSNCLTLTTQIGEKKKKKKKKQTKKNKLLNNTDV